jgi:aspartyl/asparaginyl beta-hydroxylase (cupin superfamily)
MQAGADALRRRDPAAARPLFERVVAARPGEVAAWYGLAVACRGMGDALGQIDAIDRVLGADPGHLPALLMKADHFAKEGDGRAADAFYRAALARAPAAGNLSPELREELRRAERHSAQYAKSYQDHLHATLAAAGFEAGTSSSRFSHALELLLGRKQIFLQSPTAFFYPELPHRQFYERSEFPWLPALEAETEAIRDELLQVVADDSAFRPYIQSDGARPPMDYGALLDNVGWSAFYLIRSGSVVAEAAARCPRTMKALAATPLTDAPGRTPAVLFSLLRPGVRIPPHTGYTNARLICHLPLIVPEGCGLRVGNETRSWTPGEALIFDDSIEHEAWNTSDRLRVVLLFDIWRPELSAEERTLISALLGAVGTFGGGDWV